MGVVTDIIVGNDLWQIDSIIIQELYEEDKVRIDEIVGSFKFLDEYEVRKHFQESNIPNWIRNNAHWWSQDLISEDEFVNSLKYLIQEGIIVIK